MSWCTQRPGGYATVASLPSSTSRRRSPGGSTSSPAAVASGVRSSASASVCSARATIAQTRSGVAPRPRRRRSARRRHPGRRRPARADSCRVPARSGRSGPRRRDLRGNPTSASSSACAVVEQRGEQRAPGGATPLHAAPAPAARARAAAGRPACSWVRRTLSAAPARRAVTRTGSVLMNGPDARSSPAPPSHPAEEHGAEHHVRRGRWPGPAPAPRPGGTAWPPRPRGPGPGAAAAGPAPRRADPGLAHAACPSPWMSRRPKGAVGLVDVAEHPAEERLVPAPGGRPGGSAPRSRGTAAARAAGRPPGRYAWTSPGAASSDGVVVDDVVDQLQASHPPSRGSRATQQPQQRRPVRCEPTRLPVDVARSSCRSRVVAPPGRASTPPPAGRRRRHTTCTGSGSPSQATAVRRMSWRSITACSARQVARPAGAALSKRSTPASR